MANILDKYKKQLEDLNKPKKGSGGSDDFIDLVEGKNIIRLLPGHPNMDGFYTEVYYHHRKLGGKNVSVVCPNGGDEDGGNCPICEQLAPMRRSKDKKVKDQYYNSRAKPRFFANALDRSDEEPKVKILGFGSTILKQILEMVVDPEEFGDIMDLKEGSDLIIKRTGTGLDTEYTVNKRAKTSPVLETTKAIKALIGTDEDDTQLLDLNTLGETNMSEDELMATWEGEEAPKKKGKKAADEDEEEETPRPKKKKPAPVEDEEEEEAPKPKKKKPVVEEEEEEEEAPKPKAKKKPAVEEEEEEEAPAPKKAKPVKKAVADEDEEEEDLNAILDRHAKKGPKK